MNYDEICIKIAESRGSAERLSEVADYVKSRMDDFNDDEFYYLIELMEANIDEIKKEKDMQHGLNEYNPEKHEKKKALTVKNPYASLIANGIKRIEIRSRNTSYRGELVITSSKIPKVEGMMSGCTMAIVNLYKTLPLEKISDEEWSKTCLPIEMKDELSGLGYYGWYFKEVERIVEYPVNGSLGIWNLVMDKLEFIPYTDRYESDFIKHPDKKKFDKGVVWTGSIVILIIFAIGCFLFYLFVATLIDFIN